MLGTQNRWQEELFVAAPLSSLIPDDHILKRVDKVLDLSWLRAEVRDLYCMSNGRPGIDPEAAVRLMLAGFFQGIVHDRKLMREAQVNIAIRWFAVWPIFCRLLGHWRIVLDSEESEKVSSPIKRKWSRCASLSFWISCALIFISSFIWWPMSIKIQHIYSQVDEADKSAVSQLIDKAFVLSKATMAISLISILLSIFFFAVGIFFYIKARKPIQGIGQ